MLRSMTTGLHLTSGAILNTRSYLLLNLFLGNLPIPDVLSGPSVSTLVLTILIFLSVSCVSIYKICTPPRRI